MIPFKVLFPFPLLALTNKLKDSDDNIGHCDRRGKEKRCRLHMVLLLRGN